jgi:hypothetical protein
MSAPFGAWMPVMLPPPAKVLLRLSGHLAPALCGRPPARPPQRAAQEGGGGRATRRVAEPAPCDSLPTRLQQNPRELGVLTSGLRQLERLDRIVSASLAAILAGEA